MKRVFLSVALAFVAVTTSAFAESPDSADVWVGLAGGLDGFLVDEATGAVWMSGHCLKPLSPATRQGSVWVSRTTELVSVGRMQALLDQTFVIDTDPSAPSISVENPARGGRQTFEGATLLDCRNHACADLMRIPAC